MAYDRVPGVDENYRFPPEVEGGVEQAILDGAASHVQATVPNKMVKTNGQGMITTNTPWSAPQITPKSYVDSRVPVNLPITEDNSVGKRIFIGDTMVYGDTGWRALSTWDEGVVSGFPLNPSWEPGAGSGGIYVRRVGDKVYFRIVNLNRLSVDEASVWPALHRVPTGFLPELHEPIYGLRTASSFAVINVQQNGQISRPSGVLSGDNGLHTVSGSYLSRNSWPTSLPGTPA